jgi:hypothetical protein
MLRKVALAIAGTALFSGLAAAAPFAVQPATTLPFSVSATGPNYPVPSTGRERPVTGATGAVQPVRAPMSVSEVGPNYPAPTAGRDFAITGATGTLLATADPLVGQRIHAGDDG